jgi:hypothetical protein
VAFCEEKNEQSDVALDRKAMPLQRIKVNHSRASKDTAAPPHTSPPLARLRVRALK